jgi:RNA polymerase sigma factor (TIGR02999 family)
MSEVTRILTAIQDGDGRAVDELLPVVYQELRRLATYKLANERPGQTLQATALVHEAYLRLVAAEGQSWHGRAHFFAAAAESMRRILVDQARHRRRIRHGGGRNRCDLKESDLATNPVPIDLLALDEALTKLAEEDEAKANLVKLRYFAGLTVGQAAELLGISRATADRYWAYARAWLYDKMGKGE